MPRAELGFDGSRFGYILNPPKPNKYPLNTHRYLVPASLIGGSQWGVRNPDQCPHLHHWTPIDEVARVPATPTGRPRLPRHPSGGKWDKELAWRTRRNGTRRGARAGWPRLPGVGSHSRRLRCRSSSPSGWALGSTPARDLGRKDGGEKEEEGGRERETEGRDSPTPWHAAIWSSASWMARSSDVGRWHWTHCAFFLGNRAMNCSSTTRSMIWSMSLSPANSHLRHASWSWWAITKGRPFSPSSSDRKRWRCCSGFRPTRWRMARFRSS